MAKIENTLPPILTGGTSIHDDLSGLNVGEYIHLTALEKDNLIIYQMILLLLMLKKM